MSASFRSAFASALFAAALCDSAAAQFSIGIGEGAREPRHERLRDERRERGREHRAIGTGVGIGIDIINRVTEEERLRTEERQKKKTKKDDTTIRTTGSREEITRRRKDDGKKKKDATVADTPKCCSCVESMKLVYYGVGPKTTPEGLVDVPDEDGEGTHKEKKTYRPMPSHSFQLEVFFKNHKSDPGGMITLKWFERTDHPPPVGALAGMQANTWTDMQNLMTASDKPVMKNPPHTTPGANAKPSEVTTIGELAKKPGTTPGDWYDKYVRTKARQCTDPKKLDKVLVKDQPSSYQPRRLDFHIVAESPPNCNCKIPVLELYATQLLTMEEKDKEATKKNQVSQDVGNAGFYGPGGKMTSPGTNIPGVAPDAPQPRLPAGF